ncbi:MAG: DUF1573 domain-containing protein [Kiritimatiellales bacterium]|nr:DUF1573 domain-containing protein [Kiritimatiellales bacterium]MCF7863338.1 DUF1573 domain-containing protein [Kiritimatiellales bacterium]
MKNFMTVCLLVAGTAQAAIEWEATRQTPVVHPTQVSATAVFPFTNTADHPATIAEVRVTCGCLAPKLAKQTYAPGERGEVRIDFDLRNRTGPQHKTVIVKTDDGVATTLSIECTIPEAYVLDPKIVFWRIGDSEETKTVRLVNPGTLPIKLLSIASSNEKLPAELKTVREGFEYEVVIDRTAIHSSARSVIRIATEPPPGQAEAKTLKLYVQVQ